MDIVSLHRQGLSIKAIARRLDISRNTVRLALRRKEPPAYHRPDVPSKLDPHKDYLLARLAEFPGAQRRGAVRGGEGARLCRRPFHPQGLHPGPIACAARSRWCASRPRPGAKPSATGRRLGTHLVAGQLTTLYLFVMILGFSRALYAEVVTSTELDTFLELHVHAFRSFGGMPEEILYDNQKVVVLGRGAGGPIFHPALLAFAGQFGFKPRLCRPYRAKTKGKVERSIGYVRDRFFCGRTFVDLPDLNHHLEQWLASVANAREHRTTGERPCDRLLREKLLPFSAARPWRSAQTPVAPPRRPSFRFASPEVERRRSLGL